MYVAALGPDRIDFLSFWSAARLVWEGRASAAYDSQAMHAFQAGAGSTAYYPFGYPPPFLLVVAPFGLAPYAVALALWTGLGFTAYFAVARRLLPQGLWLVAAIPASFINAINGQNGFLTASLLLGGLMLLDRRPWLAGALLGALVIKPQLALLIPLALLAGRRWRAIGGAAISSLGLLAATELLLPGTLHAFLSSAGLARNIVETPTVLRKIQSVFATVAILGAPLIAAAAAQGVCALVAGWTVWRAWRGRGETVDKAAVLLAAIPLATPYIFDYDLVFLILPLSVIAHSRPRLAGALYVAPGITRGVSFLGLGLAPLAMAALLWAGVRPQPEPRRAV